MDSISRWIPNIVAAIGGGVLTGSSLLFQATRHGTRIQAELERIAAVSRETIAKLESLDDRYLTRREFELVQKSISESLKRIEDSVQRLVSRELNTPAK